MFQHFNDGLKLNALLNTSFASLVSLFHTFCKMRLVSLTVVKSASGDRHFAFHGAERASHAGLCSLDPRVQVVCHVSCHAQFGIRSLRPMVTLLQVRSLHIIARLLHKIVRSLTK